MEEDKVADIVANMEEDKVANMVADMEGRSWWLCWQWCRLRLLRRWWMSLRWWRTHKCIRLATRRLTKWLRRWPRSDFSLAFQCSYLAWQLVVGEPLRCIWCDQKIADNNNLRLHMMSHSGEKKNNKLLSLRLHIVRSRQSERALGSPHRRKDIYMRFMWSYI